MAEDDDVRSFVGAAKDRGASDETLLMLLHDKGWSDRSARRILSEHYERQIGVEIPRRHDPAASNPLDGFLYVFATGTLVTWVTAAILLGNGFIDSALPEPLSAGYDTGSTWDLRQTVDGLATLLVTCPVYLALMAVLHRRLRLGVTSWTSPVRLWILSATLLVGVATILGYLVATLAKLLAGAPTAAALWKSAYALVILAALTLYYLRWLKAKGRPEEAH